MKNSKKTSCCVRGGDWFKQCGDVGDSNFDHTWTEGVQACKLLTRLFLDRAQKQVMRHHETTQAQLNTTRDRNGLQEQVIVDSFSVGVSVDGSKEYCEISTITTVFLFAYCLYLHPLSLFLR